MGKQLVSDGCDRVFARAALLPQQATEFNAGMSQHFTVTQTAPPARRLGPLVRIGTVLNLMHKSEEEEIQTIVWFQSLVNEERLQPAVKREAGRRSIFRNGETRFETNQHSQTELDPKFD